MSQRVTEQLTPELSKNPLILYATPSISLTAQSRREWLRNTKTGLQTLVICSDSDAGNNEGEIGIEEIEAPVTTDPQTIALRLAHMLESANGKMTGIFCTYQSIDKMIAAQNLNEKLQVHIAIADEAHNTTGIMDDETRNFQKIHHELDAVKRLYQTATPKVYSTTTLATINRTTQNRIRRSSARVVDMSDQNIYGPEMHKTSFKQAIKKNSPRLCDYRIVMVMLPQRTSQLEAVYGHSARQQNLSLYEKTAALGRSMFSIQDINMPATSISIHACIAYANTKTHAKLISTVLNLEDVSNDLKNQMLNEGVNIVNPDARLTSGTILGTHRQSERMNELNKLTKAREEQSRHVTTNCKVLSEGVDVPTLDAIAFMEPKKSPIEIIQAVGRVMRKPVNSEKELGYIIIPVIIEDAFTPDFFAEDVLAGLGDDFKVIGQVLQAIKSHDGDIETHLHEKLVISIADRYNPPTDDIEQETNLRNQFLNLNYKDLIPALTVKSGLRLTSKEVAENIQSTIKRAAGYLMDDRFGLRAAKLLDIDVPSLQKNQQERRKALQGACEQAMIFVLQACLVQQRIIDSAEWSNNKLTKLADIARNNDPATQLSQDWAVILEHDFQPIFGLAKKILDAFLEINENHTIRKAISTIAENAGEHAEEYANAGEDRAGELFQAAMKDPSSEGAFYTKPASATLIAELICELLAPKEESFWNGAEWKNQKIVDPSCGSGTLLVAMKSAILRRTQKTKRGELGKDLVENTIYGLDVNAHALQLSATQLIINSLNANYEKINIFKMPVGKGIVQHEGRDNTVYSLGSLELLFHYLRGDQLKIDHDSKADTIMHKNDVEIDNLANLLHKSATIIVANPPFTIGHKMLRNQTEETRNRIQDRLSNLRTLISESDFDAGNVVNTGSISPYFTVLMNELISESGFIAKICPTIAITGASGLSERLFLSRKFDVLYILTSLNFKSNCFNWSVDTGISESIIILKRKQNKHPPQCQFIQLTGIPRNSAEAIDIVESITRSKAANHSTSHTRSQDYMGLGMWSPVMYFNTELASMADDIENIASTRDSLDSIGSLYNVHMTRHDAKRLGEINSMETGHTSGSIHYLESSKNAVHTHIEGKAEGLITPKHDVSEEQWSNFLKKTGHLLMLNRIDTHASRLTAVVMKTKSAGGAWHPVSGITYNEAKRVSVWLNSVIGRILIQHRHSNKFTYQKFESGAFKAINVPKPLKPGEEDSLFAAYEKTSNIKVTQFREGASEAHEIWDRAVADYLNLEPEYLLKIRSLLDKEPMFKGNFDEYIK